MLEISMDWQGGLAFQGRSVFGHTIVTDGAKEAGGGESGYKPTELVLFGIAGCTGVDVVRILQKQRQQLESLSIQVVAHQNDDYPKPFHTVEVKYIATGKDLDESKLAKAIELSEGKYCVVSQTVQEPTTVKTSYEIREG